MARKAHPAGPSTRQLVEDAPLELAYAVLNTEIIEGETRIDLPPVPDAGTDEDRRKALLDGLANLDRDLLQLLEVRCQQVVGLSEGKGTSSLDTVTDQHLSDDDIEIYRSQNDPLCRSIWTYLHHREVFEDAESFHAARRFRDYGRLYNAFEVDLDKILNKTSRSINCERLGAAMTKLLDLKTPCTVRAIDLPATTSYPTSVMIIVRHGGPLSSVHHHHNDGQRRTLYYRPANEATLIYTPEHRKIEVCSDSRPVRDVVARCFAEEILEHDVSAKPLTWKSYDLARFRESLSLPAPEIDGFDITFAKVVELSVQLDSSKRYLTLKVAVVDDIEAVATRYLGAHSALRRADRITRLKLAVEYHRRGDVKKRSLGITVTDTGSCNVQSMRDPEERRLGFALLEEWGMMQTFKPIDPDDLRLLFPSLVRLYDRIDNNVPASLLRDLRLDPRKLLTAGLLERLGREDVVLLGDEDPEGEGTVVPSRYGGRLQLKDTFGGDVGELPAELLTRYRLNVDWLLETIVDLLKPLLARHAVAVLDECLVKLGTMNINGSDVPVYLARRLDQPKTLDRIAGLLHGAATANVGLILSASPQPPRWLGSNVVVPVLTNVTRGDRVSVLSRDAIAFEFSAGRTLARGGNRPSVQRNGQHGGTLHVPGKSPLTLAGNEQITICERLVNAHNGGAPDIHVKELMNGLGSRSPKPAFATKARDGIFGVYITQGAKNGFWRLKVDPTSVSTAI